MAAFPHHPRMERTVRTASSFLLETGVRTLPVDPAEIIRSRGWRLQPYTGAADRSQLSLGEFRAEVGTQDAFTVLRRRPVIFYNDTIISRERIAFSLCHEIGHVILGHFADFRPDTLTAAQLALLDVEADVFAANLLAPSPVADAIAPEKRPRCREMFGLSRTAWERRLTGLAADLACLTPDDRAAILTRFDAWMHAHRCRDCHHAFHGGRVCPRCGSTRIAWDPQRLAVRIIPPCTGRIVRPTPPARGVRRMLEAELENPMIER